MEMFPCWIVSWYKVTNIQTKTKFRHKDLRIIMNVLLRLNRCWIHTNQVIKKDKPKDSKTKLNIKNKQLMKNKNKTQLLCSKNSLLMLFSIPHSRMILSPIITNNQLPKLLKIITKMHADKCKTNNWFNNTEFQKVTSKMIIIPKI